VPTLPKTNGQVILPDCGFFGEESQSVTKMEISYFLNKLKKGIGNARQPAWFEGQSKKNRALAPADYRQ
jgi:hypothetical protein